MGGTDIEILTTGIMSTYFLALIVLKILTFDTIDSYIYMYNECSTLFKWFAVNIAILVLNIVYSKVGQTMHVTL